MSPINGNEPFTAFLKSVREVDTILHVAVENGIKEGFDFALAHQLISACFTHRKLLSKGSATQINRWYEQFRRLKKSGGKRKRKTEPLQPTGPLLVDPAVDTVTETDRKIRRHIRRHMLLHINNIAINQTTSRANERLPLTFEVGNQTIDHKRFNFATAS
ncbi:hypothetical protein KIN20_005322 [Parelaphostrongylus tenuis]|uniref:ZMIZ1 N-terminal domain-containing protein n=1 Tax=Parelaphostrongylus tenuis TaxID=148309 RepID=A0AAD5MIP4_PARTN|nr:hypothetical protein KIN20_005322 [Parelaphostrongylus tenuis]